MFLFLRLLLGHLIGDFVLQTDSLYKKKVEGITGHILHSLILAVVFTAFSWPYIKDPRMWAFIFLVSCSHILFDWLKIKFINRALSFFWAFALDQVLHIASLLLVLFFDFSWQAPAIKNNLFVLYNSDKLIIILSGYLVASFVGTYLLDSFKKDFLKGIAEKEVPKSLNYFLFERVLATTIFCFLKVYFYPLALILFLGRVVFGKKANWADFLLNLSYSAAIGTGMKLLLT